LKPTSKIFSFATMETVFIRLRKSRIISFVSGQLDSISRISSKIVKVPIHSLMQFVRVSKGRIFVGIGQTLRTVKSTSWHLLTRSSERLTLPRTTTKVFRIQEHVTARINLTAWKTSRVVSTVQTTLTKATNRIPRISLVEYVSLIRVSHKTVRILSGEIVRKFIGKAVSFTQHTALSLRRTTLKVARIVSGTHLTRMISFRRAYSAILRSAQSLREIKTVRRTIQFTQGQIARISRRVSTIRMIHSLQSIAIIRRYPKTIVVSWRETLAVRRASIKLIRARIASRLIVPRTTFKRVGFVVRNKVQQGIMYRQALNL
jgi:hypothetical protein